MPISIHAPLAGCDGDKLSGAKIRVGFQSTHPWRGATGASVEAHNVNVISIHAPLAGCDYFSFSSFPFLGPFQSTHPWRGATAKMCKMSKDILAILANFSFIIEQIMRQLKAQADQAAAYSAIFGANRPDHSCSHPVRTTGSVHLLHHSRVSRRSVPLLSGNYCPDCKTAGCPAPGP